MTTEYQSGILAVIRKFTKPQRDALGEIATLNRGGYHPRTIKALEHLGLIEAHQETHGHVFGVPLYITRYEVPLAVHIAWCTWCSEDEAIR